MRQLDIASRIVTEQAEEAVRQGGGIKRHASSSSSSSSKRRQRGGTKRSSDDTSDGDAPVVTPEALAQWRDLCMRCANEKVGLAGQIYDLIDTQILHIDADLRRFEQDMGFTPPNNEALNESAGTNLAKKVVPLAAAPSGKTGQEGVIDTGLPIDPNEPVYCICQRVAFGDMVSRGGGEDCADNVVAICRVYRQRASHMF